MGSPQIYVQYFCWPLCFIDCCPWLLSLGFQHKEQHFHACSLGRTWAIICFVGPQEAYGQGAFTTEFLKLLQRFPIDALRYHNISTFIKIPEWGAYRNLWVTCDHLRVACLQVIATLPLCSQVSRRCHTHVTHRQVLGIYNFVIV